MKRRVNRFSAALILATCVVMGILATLIAGAVMARSQSRFDITDIRRRLETGNIVLGDSLGELLPPKPRIAIAREDAEGRIYGFAVFQHGDEAIVAYSYEQRLFAVQYYAYPPRDAWYF